MQKIRKEERYVAEIITYVQMHWLQWLFAGASFALGVLYRNINKRLEEEQEKNKAIADGIQSLLRESIISNYNKYSDRGCCPIYAKDSIKRVYGAYHNLDGNDVATELYKKILAMPEDSEEKEK